MSTEENKGLVAKAAAESRDVRVRIEARAAEATSDERDLAEKILSKATEGKVFAEYVSLTSGTAAILFTAANAYNRDWRATRSIELARQIDAGEWEVNNAAIGFYNSGNLGDGQHRLGAFALADSFSCQILIAYGMHEKAVLTIDNGNRRTAADALKLENITAPKKKESLIKTAGSYLHKIGTPDMQLRSNVEVAAAMRNYDDLLSESIRIGDESLLGIVSPIFKASHAYVVAFLCLYHEWPADVVIAELHNFQTGHAGEDGEKAPLFVAGEYIAMAREKAKGRESLRTQGELGVVLKAMMLTASGVRAVRSAELKAAVKTLPIPSFPGLISQAA